MKGLLIVVVLIVAGVVGMGYYLGWFHFDVERTNGASHITLTVEQKKIQDDEKKAAEKVLGKD